MEEIATKSSIELLQFGVAGVFIIFLIAALYFVIKWHRSERSEWREEFKVLYNDNKALHQKTMDIQKETIEVISEFKYILTHVDKNVEKIEDKIP
jgi:hypothetical protein